MKALVIVFLIALALSCLLGSSQIPSYPSKAGIADVEETPDAAGMKRGESTIPDMRVTDGYRHVYFMHKVGDTDNSRQTDFPMQALQ